MTCFPQFSGDDARPRSGLTGKRRYDESKRLVAGLARSLVSSSIRLLFAAIINHTLNTSMYPGRSSDIGIVDNARHAGKRADICRASLACLPLPHFDQALLPRCGTWSLYELHAVADASRCLKGAVDAWSNGIEENGYNILGQYNKSLPIITDEDTITSYETASAHIVRDDICNGR